MAKIKGPKKTNRYPDEFKIKAIQLAAYPDILAKDVAEDDSWVLDFGEWASVYRIWLARQAEYRNEIQRQQANAPSLAGLINVSP